MDGGSSSSSLLLLLLLLPSAAPVGGPPRDSIADLVDRSFPVNASVKESFACFAVFSNENFSPSLFAPLFRNEAPPIAAPNTTPRIEYMGPMALISNDMADATSTPAGEKIAPCRCGYKADDRRKDHRHA